MISKYIEALRSQFKGRFWLVFFMYLLSLSVYGIFLKLGYYNTFSDAEFLHLPFIRDLDAKRFELNNFFTVYYEHLFPGYNLLLIANYFLFGISAKFNLIVSFLTCAFVAAVFLWQVLRVSKPINKNSLLFVGGLLILIASPVKNPMAGMSIAADMGVAFLVLIAALLETAKDLPKSQFYKVLQFFAVVFFLGGYSVGLGISVGLGLVCLFKLCQITRKDFLSLGFTLVGTFVVYISILSHYSTLFKNAPTHLAQDFSGISSFFLSMMGASVLGKAYFEANPLTAYFTVCGFLLSLMMLVAVINIGSRIFRKICQRNDRTLGV